MRKLKQLLCVILSIIIAYKIKDALYTFNDPIYHTTYNQTSTVEITASLNEKTFSNYEYTKIYGNPNTWEFRRPSQGFKSSYFFRTYEINDQNAHYISTFVTAVETINVKEGEIVTALGACTLSFLSAGAAGAGTVLTGGALTPAAWASLLTAAGCSTAYINICMQYNNACQNAYDAYMDILTKSDVIFY